MKKYVIALVSVILLVALDQWTKLLAAAHLMGTHSGNRSTISLIPGVFELTYLENRGAAFGIFQNQRWLFMVLTSIVMLFIIYMFIRLPESRRYYPLHIISIFLISGAAGNMIDRVFHGYVVDFFYFSLIDFPVFNVADIYVTVTGIVFAIVYMFYYKEDEFDFLKWKETPKREEC